MSFTRIVYRRIRGEAWPVVVPMYKLRQCPECFALVLGWEGQEGHEAFDHGYSEDLSDDDAPPLGGYVIGNGELPPETRGESDWQKPERPSQ